MAGDEAVLSQRSQARPAAAYCGFDPTASSLHVGHLLSVLGLRHLARAGLQPIALVGGATGLIGDPSGRSTERNQLERDAVAENAKHIAAQLERLCPEARVLNNAEWLAQMPLTDYLYEVTRAVTARPSHTSRVACR